MYITQADALLGAKRRSLTNQAVLVPGKTYESSNSQVSLVGHCGDWSPQTFGPFANPWAHRRISFAGLGFSFHELSMHTVYRNGDCFSFG